MKLLLIVMALIFLKLPSQSQQLQLNVIAIVSVPNIGKEVSSQSWERGLEILPGAHLAVRHISESNILGNYSLNLTEIITEGCDVNTALVEFVGHVKQDTVGVVGPLCNEAAYAIASLANYDLFHFVQVSPARVPRFKDTIQYPYLYHMLPSSNTYIEAVLDLMEEFNWNKIGVLCGSNEDHYYCRAAESFVLSISDKELLFYGEVASEEPSITPTLEYLRESGAKIIVAFLPLLQVSHVVSAAYTKGMIWPDYVWILPDQDMERISELTEPEADGLFILQPQLEAGDENFHIISNVTYSEYYNEYLELLASGTSLRSNPYANVYYDSVWAIALALNSTIHSLDHNINIGKISKELSLLSFPGTLGNVEFNGSHSRTNTTVDIFYIRNREAQHVGFYNQVSGTVININLFNDIPSDELQKHYTLFSPALTWTVTFITASCLLFITAMLFLYWCYRNEPEVKATSTRLSLFMFLGCYLMGTAALMDAVFDSMRVPSSQGEAFCSISIWNTYIGGALILATLMVKLLRVYRIFTLFGKTGRLYSDAGLVVMILILVSGIAILLTVWTAVDAYSVIDIETFNSETTPPHYDSRQKCYSEYDMIWVSTSTAYLASIFVPLLLLSFKTRMVWRHNFKDTKKVTALVFILGFFTSLCLPLWFLLEQYELSNLTIIVFYTAVPTCTQLFLFVPKVVPPLVRQFQTRF